MRLIPRPESGLSRGYRFPPVHEHQLANGLTVLTVPLHRLPVVTLAFAAEAGGECDPIAQAGLSALTARALVEGTIGGVDDAAGGFESLGGELESDAGWAHGECSTTVMADRAGEAIDRLAVVVREPRWSSPALARLQQERLAELLQRQAEPRELADDLFAQTCFPTESRYALPLTGTERTVAACGGEDVVRHHARRYRTASGVVVICGAISPDTATAACERAFGNWRTERAAETAEGTPERVPSGAVWLAHRASAPQSEIRIGHAGVPRTHPDFYALSVMNAVLGGLFNSRINLNLRERHAYTYGAFSTHSWRLRASLWEVATAVESDVTLPAIREVLGEIEKIRQQAVAGEELSLAKSYLIGVFPLRFETTAALSAAILMRRAFRLGASYYDDYRARIDEVSVADVQRVAATHLRPELLQIVVVGDRERVEDSLRRLERGDVVPVDPLA